MAKTHGANFESQYLQLATTTQLWRGVLRCERSRFALQISSGVHGNGCVLVGISHQCISNERFGPRRHRTKRERGLAAAAAVASWWLLKNAACSVIICGSAGSPPIIQASHVASIAPNMHTDATDTRRCIYT